MTSHIIQGSLSQPGSSCCAQARCTALVEGHAVGAIVVFAHNLCIRHCPVRAEKIAAADSAAVSAVAGQDAKEVVDLQGSILRQVSAVHCIAALVGTKAGAQAARPQRARHLWIRGAAQLPHCFHNITTLPTQQSRQLQNKPSCLRNKTELSELVASSMASNAESNWQHLQGCAEQARCHRSSKEKSGARVRELHCEAWPRRELLHHARELTRWHDTAVHLIELCCLAWRDAQQLQPLKGEVRGNLCQRGASGFVGERVRLEHGKRCVGAGWQRAGSVRAKEEVTLLRITANCSIVAWSTAT